MAGNSPALLGTRGSISQTEEDTAVRREGKAKQPARRPSNCAKSFVTRGEVKKWAKGYVAPKVAVTVEAMDSTMSQTTRNEVLSKLRRRYQNAGREHRRKLLDQ